MFLLQKLLAATPLGNFLTSFVGQILLILVLAVGGYYGFQFWLSKHDEFIRKEALVDFNTARLEEIERAREEFERRLEEARLAQEERIQELIVERERLEQEAEGLLDEIRNGGFEGGDDLSSETLRETIRALQGRANGGN